MVTGKNWRPRFAEERGAAVRPPPPARGAQAAYASETVRRSDGSASFSIGGPPGGRMRVGSAKRRRESDPYLAWLDSPKNLSGRARAEASGLVRVVSPDGRIRRWVEAADVAALLADGYQPDA